jgi:hypothetical protein
LFFFLCVVMMMKKGQWRWQWKKKCLLLFLEVNDQCYSCFCLTFVCCWCNRTSMCTHCTHAFATQIHSLCDPTTKMRPYLNCCRSLSLVCSTPTQPSHHLERGLDLPNAASTPWQALWKALRTTGVMDVLALRDIWDKVNWINSQLVTIVWNEFQPVPTSHLP